MIDQRDLMAVLRSQEMARPRRSPSETMADLRREFAWG